MVASADCPAKIWATGSNQYGQLGNGETGGTYDTPILVETFDEGILDVVGGYQHSIVVTADGAAWVAGSNNNGQLGQGDLQDRPTFTKVEGLPNNIVRAAAGESSTFFITGDGNVFATGLNTNGQLGINDTISRNSSVQVLINNVGEVAAGWRHTFFRKYDNTIFAAGRGGAGRLCLGDHSDRVIPAKTNLTDIVQFDAGNGHSVFLKDDGTAWSCGRNRQGQLGIGDDLNRDTIQSVSNITSTVAAIATSAISSMFVLSDGNVKATGRNEDGELGVGDSVNRWVPSIVSIDSVVSARGTAGYHLHYLRDDGSWYGIGDNEFGQLGVGDSFYRDVPIEIVAFPEDIISFVSGGLEFTLFGSNGTCAPSMAPTATLAPSAMPTKLPSATPSAIPSFSPSVMLTTVPSEKPSTASSSGLSAGAQAGIAVGAVAGFFCIAAMLVLATRKKNKSKAQSNLVEAQVNEAEMTIVAQAELAEEHEVATES